MTKKLLEIAAEIVQAQASVGQMPPEQIELALLKTFATLQKMQKAEEEGVLLDSGKALGEAGTEAAAPETIDPRESIQEDRVICLECGAKMKQLTGKHLTSHGMSIREYRQKWGFPLKQSLSAKSLSRARSKAAKKRGLPENLVKYQEERKLKKQEATVAGSAAGIPEANANKESKAGPKRSRKKKAE